VVLPQHPLLVVRPLELEEGQAELLDGLETPHPQQILLERADEAFRDAVAFGLSHETRRALDPEERDLLLKIVGQIVRPVVVTKTQPAGDAFAHGIRDMDIDDEVVELFRERPHVLLAPNLPNPGVASDLSWLSGTIPPDQLEQMQERSVDRPEAQEAFGIQARNLVRLAAEGVTIAFGTDGSAGWSPHAEMEDLVRAGMQPADVLVAATGNSAALVGLDDVGTLEANKSADFIVLEANPIDDITNTRQIADVYLRGEAVDRAGLSAGWLAEATP